jgi:xanthine dehydrogenase accessory factor
MALELIKAISEGCQGMALATIVQVQGSSPRHPGAKMLVGAPQGQLGTVGGGRGEAMALEACRRCLADRASALLKVEMVGTDVAAQTMVCGGVSTMLIEHLQDPAPYAAAWARLALGERVVLVKRLLAPGRVATAVLDERGGVLHGRVEPGETQAAVRALERGQAHYDPERQVLCDPLLPQEKLLILGAGHVGQALAALAPALGFTVTVVDDRAEFLAEGRLPAGVQAVEAGFEQAIAAFPFDSATYVVVVTRGHQSDLQCVRAVLGHRYRYAGFMGSARKTRLIIDQVRQEGFDPAKVDALCGPIGLEVGAETPFELAVAILGEIIAVRRNAPLAAALQQGRDARRA